MGSNDIIVREYLESLKEDTELDYLFPILLNLMGFRIVTTARESKGQSQYGKDIVAIGFDENGVKKRFYFELKGHADKDITQGSLFKPDGILESIREAKFTNFSDPSIPEFNQLPKQIVVVHNGILKNDSRVSLEGIIAQEFPNGGFERWDIYRLTDLFTKHLFGEYLFTDEKTIRLFKRALVLLDAPDYDFSDFKQLIQLQTQKTYELGTRKFKKFFASMNLLSVIVIHYSKDNNNLYPARECVTYLILQVWDWVLKNELERKNGVLKEFRKLLTIHFNLLNDYFLKTNVAVKQLNGLYSEAGQMFEMIGYPLRSMEYLNYLTYFFYARLYFPGFDHAPSSVKLGRIVQAQLNYLVNLLNQNDAAKRPLIDNHSIAILNVVLFILRNQATINNDKELVSNFLVDVLNNLVIIKNTRDRFPELYNNIEALTEFAAKSTRPHNYIDSSSLLVTCIFELIALVDDEETYNFYRSSFTKTLNLQTAYCDLPTEDMEPLLFQKNLYREMHVDAGIKLPDSLAEFQSQLAAKNTPIRNYRTDEAGFPFLRYLAHIYYKNEFLPDEWRKFGFPQPFQSTLLS
jgi:hypothetical protein